MRTNQAVIPGELTCFAATGCVFKQALQHKRNNNSNSNKRNNSNKRKRM